MQDTRTIKILLRNARGEFLVLRRADEVYASQTIIDLPGASQGIGQTDAQAMDSALSHCTGLLLNTEEAIQIGFDSEYEPGVGTLTRVLYMLKIDNERPHIVLGSEFVSFDWASLQQLREFEPPYQVLVQTAIDFYLPPEV